MRRDDLWQFVDDCSGIFASKRFIFKKYYLRRIENCNNVSQTRDPEISALSSIVNVTRIKFFMRHMRRDDLSMNVLRNLESWPPNVLFQ